MSGTPPAPPDPRAVLVGRLAAAEQALHDLTIGGKAEVVTYASGDGSKSATFTRASIPALRAYIAELQAKLGMGRRRALVPAFGGDRPRRRFYGDW